MLIKMLAAKAAPTLCASVPLLLCHWYLDPTCQKIFNVFILDSEFKDTGFYFHISSFSLNTPCIRSADIY